LADSIILIQNNISIFSVHLLWTVMSILFVLTLILFAVSVTARMQHRKNEKLAESYRDKWYPIILAYLNKDLSRNKVEQYLTDDPREYSVFEEIIYEMMENLKGTEVTQLQEVLHLSPIFDYHFKQLQSHKTVNLIKACSYFSYIRLENYKVIEKLKSFLSSGNSMLAFSAASALMASKEVEIRAKALRAIAQREKFSRMALLEMIYKFHSKQLKQETEESQVMRELIKDKKVSPVSAGILIQGAIELGYQDLMPFFFNKMKSTKYRWNNSDVLPALIRAQGNFFNIEATEEIKRHINHKSPEVRRSVVESLGKFGGQENLEAIFGLLDDDNFQVKLAAVTALDENGAQGEKLLQLSYSDTKLNIRSLVESL